MLATELPVAELASLDYAELEGHMGGHPWLVANKGRLGFSASDTERWAPEGRTAGPLPWIAVREGLAEYRGVPGLAQPHRLYARELSHRTLLGFDETLRSRGLAPEQLPLSAGAPLAVGRDHRPLVRLLARRGGHRAAEHGRRSAAAPAVDPYVPQHQQARPAHRQAAARDLNTLVWRGLPTERTLAAPAVTSWVQSLRDGDPFLSEECRVILLGEVASVAVAHPVYEQLPDAPYQYRELLGCIWREPLTPYLASGERARTLAALIHTDAGGRALTAELVRRSGLEPGCG